MSEPDVGRVPAAPGSSPCGTEAAAHLRPAGDDPSREIEFSRTRYLRYVPPVEGDLSTRRHWVIVHEPGRIPEKKGGFSSKQVNGFLGELIACRPTGTRYTVVSLTWDFDIWVQDGHEYLREDEILDEYYRDRDASLAEKPQALSPEGVAARAGTASPKDSPALRETLG